jgi:hypothetical protein
MDKKLVILISIGLISAITIAPALNAITNSKTLLPDSFVLRNIEGRLIKQNKDLWLFDTNSPSSNKKERPDIKEMLEILPSSALDSVTVDANLSDIDCRLWGRVTKYKGRNFIFPTYFLPLSEANQPSLTSQQSQEENEPAITEPNDELLIPKEILDKLKTRRPIRSSGVVGERSEKKIKIKQNFVLVNRTGFLEKCADGSMIFKLNALGRSIQQEVIKLLPCEVLELAEQIQSAEPDPIRFAIAGIVTEYKGCKYLLLQRATRVYSHGNFGK